MINNEVFKKIHDLDNLKNYVDGLEAADITFNGKRKLYSANENRYVTVNEVVKKFYKCYNEKYFVDNYSVVSEKDLKNVISIIKNIRKLDELSDEKLNKKSVLIKIIHWFAHHFGKKITIKSDNIFNKNRIVNRKDLLCEIEKNSIDPSERNFLNNNINTNLNEDVKNALTNSYENYYKFKYKDKKIKSSQAKWKVHGEVIHKYNHGLAHSTRKAFFIPFIVNYFEKNSLDHLSLKLNYLFEKEGKEKVIAKLQIVTAFGVAGRDSECGFSDNFNVYKKYSIQSQKAFIKYCKEADLVGKNKLFEDEENLHYYADAIKNKYSNRALGEKMDVLTAIIDMAHTFDLFRCYWPSRMKSNIEAMNGYSKNKNSKDLWSLAKFCQQAVKITGDRLMTEFANDQIPDRNLKFKMSNFKSFVYHNFHLSKSRTFLKCSKDANYTWDLLKGVPQPISFSSGETTHTYLEKHVGSIENSSISQTTSLNQSSKNPLEEVAEIISGTRAAIRLVNTENNAFQFEMKMLNDPVFFRPLRDTPHDRDYVLTNRENGTVQNRGYKEREPLMEQKDLDSAPDKPNWGPVHRSNDRGKAKFTNFTKKVSVSILRKDGKVIHFKGRWPTEYYNYMPVGMLYDVDKLNQKNSKFVFAYDASTADKFWVGQDSRNKVGDKINRKENLTLKDLQGKLNDDVNKAADPIKLPVIYMQHASNESLMGLKKTALKAVFSPTDTASERVRVFLHAVYLAQDHGIRVPVLILDGKTKPRVYSRESLENDLKKLIKSKGVGKKVFDNLKSCFFNPEESCSVEGLLKKCTECMNSNSPNAPLLPDREQIL